MHTLSMVISYGEKWSILQTAWLNCSKVGQATVQTKERMNICDTQL